MLICCGKISSDDLQTAGWEGLEESSISDS
jgi:hypothetical protein